MISHRQTLSILPTQIYTGNCKDYDCDDLSNRILDIKKELNKNSSDIGGWQSMAISPNKFKRLENFDDLKSIQEEIKGEIDKVCDVWNLKELEFKQFWFRVHEKGDFCIPHSNFGSVFSCEYFVKSDEKSGQLVFDRQDSQRNFISPDKIKSHTHLTGNSFILFPNTETYVIYPSHLTQRTSVTESEDCPRISLVFTYA